MLFRSGEEQRKYLWANEPTIAKRWEKYPKGYNTGGVSHLFRSKEDRTGFNKGTEKKDETNLIIWGKSVTDQWPNLNESQKDYIRKHYPQHVPKGHAQGGYIRPEDSGVLGLAGGGQLVKPGPGRPGYNGWESDFSSDWGGEAEPQGSPPGTDPGPGQQETTVTDYEYEAYNPPETVTPTRDDHAPPGEEGGPGYISPEDLKTLQFKEIIRREEEEKTEAWEKEQKWEKKNIFQRAVDYVKNNPLEALLNVASFGGYEEAKQLMNVIKFAKGAKKFSESEMGITLTSKVKEVGKKLAEEMKAHNAKVDLYNSLPDGHPEKISLSVELQIGKKPPTAVGDGDGEGDKGPIDITYENIEETNKQKEMIAASKRQYDMLYTKPKEDRSKQMAYWQSLMAPYMGGAMGMAAEGGRVPGGYNTGGLSNLFRLKNR